MEKIAICHHPGYFSDRWIQYCQENGIDYKIVNPYQNDIMSQLSDCTAFMWQYGQTNYKDMIFAKSLMASLEQRGMKVFPNVATGWHFDDKVAQKYLLESIGAPLVPTYVFYTKEEALSWVREVSFPKVFKLKGGAGASNVKLAHTRKEAEKLIKQAFGSGFRQYRWKEHFREELRRYKMGKQQLRGVVKTVCMALRKYPTELDHYQGKEIGYVYFQDFIPNNTYDIRICIVGDKAFALKRMTRKDDFRASGSGMIIYDRTQIDERCVQIAFAVNEKLQAQSIAYDFVFDQSNQPLIVEISYGYAVKAYDYCEGYWSSDMQWHNGSHFNFCGWMVENLLK